jgi:hypothetical protein
MIAGGETKAQVWASRKEERSGTDAGGQKAKVQRCEEDKGWSRRTRRLRIDEDARETVVVVSVGWDGTHSVFWRGVKHCSSHPLTGQAIKIWGCLPEGGSAMERRDLPALSGPRLDLFSLEITWR